jgi:hypothetical protein
VLDQTPLNPRVVLESNQDELDYQPPASPGFPTVQESSRMLDVHPPHHAASSWRDFFVHIATIVIGLCIAVGIEQTRRALPQPSHSGRNP